MPFRLHCSVFARSHLSNPSCSCGRGVEGVVEEAAAAEKVIVFSQWTRMLDLVQATLQQERIRFSRLDGTMNVPNREHAIAKFTVRSLTHKQCCTCY